MPVETPIPIEMPQASRSQARPAPRRAPTPPPSPIVSQTRRAAALALMWARVLWLALRIYRDPLRTARALGRLRVELARVRRGRSGKLAFVSGRYFWNLYAPGWPSAAFDRYVERELDRLDPVVGRPHAVQFAIVAITRRCALRCEHCCEWDALNQPEALSSDALYEIARRLQRTGVAQLFLSGGEPLRRFDDLLALTASVRAETDVWILSSGLGLTEHKAARLYDAGLTGVVLSLDHWDASAHDRFRGVPGSFEAVRRAAASARGAGLLVALSLCPTRRFVSGENLHRYAETARSMGASFVQIIEPKPVGHYEGQDVTLEPAQQRELERFAERLNLDPGVRDFPSAAYPDWAARNYGCAGAGARYVYVDTEGTVHACPFCRAPGAHILDEDFDQAVAKLQVAGCPARYVRRT